MVVVAAAAAVVVVEGVLGMGFGWSKLEWWCQPEASVKKCVYQLGAFEYVRA